MARNLPHVKTYGDPLLCMVVDCGRVALFRGTSGKRGYCRTHKDMALPSAPGQSERRSDETAQRLEAQSQWRASHQ